MPVVVSIAPGEDLLDALARASSGTENFVQATGAIDAVEIRAAAEGADPVRALRGRWTLASLVGPGGGPFGVTLARASDTGLDVVAGELVRARSAGVVAAIFHAQNPVATATQPRRAESPPAPGVRGDSAAPQPVQSQWAVSALATAASARAKQVPDEEPIWPGPGDLVQ